MAKNQPQELTAEDQRVCLMVGILMIVSKIEKDARANVMLLDAEGAAEKSAKDFKLLIENAWKFFPRGDMEQHVIAFAKSLGFQVEQQYVTGGSSIPQ